MQRELRRRGAVRLRQVGSHERWQAATADGAVCRTTVPVHGGDIPVGTLASIERAMEPAFGKGWLRG